MFDVTNRDSFTNVFNWLEEAREAGHDYMTFMLVGNKVDLDDE